MPAPNQTSRSTHRAHPHSSDTGPLRLTMAESTGRNGLDGVWWPRSRQLAQELTDLVDHFPVDRLGRVTRVLVSPADWDTLPRHVLVRGGYVQVLAFPREDPHVVHLATTFRTLLHVLVVPPSFTRAQGDEAIKAGTTADDKRSASALLEQVVDHPSPTRPRR